jgi:hypothetical protein
VSIRQAHAMPLVAVLSTGNEVMDMYLSVRHMRCPG